MPPNPAQLDLLDWEPPEVVRAFDPATVRGATLEGRIARAVSVALQECGVSRAEIAERMSQFLGQKISLNVLNAYASAGREDHVISLPRFMALIHATRDQRLLELLAEPFGLAVIAREHVPLIEVALIGERQVQLQKRREALLRQTRAAR